MQHGGRDNDWRHRPWACPETIRRAAAHLAGTLEKYLEHCIVDTKPLRNFLRAVGRPSLTDAIDDYLSHGKRLYAALVDAGIPWQDARRVLPIGLTTYLHMQFNYLSLQRFLANRLEHVMDWEINCVAQLMVREVNIQCPGVMGKHLMSHSDKAGKAMFAGMDSWPPDQKYPAEYDPKTRTHHSRQMPFWVLHPAALKGGPVHWIPTNGVYPHKWLEEVGTL
jgi:thymidylate synthase ThyX